MDHRTLEKLTFIDLLQKDMKKNTDEQPDGRDAQGEVCGKGRGACTPPLGSPLSQHQHMFTSMRFFETLTVGKYGGLSDSHDQ